MRSRLWLALAVVAALAAAGWYLASPIFAFRALGAAARDGDAPRLERLVDFPRVRASLKDQLNARLIGSLQGGSVREGPFGALGALLGAGIVERVVDVAVTPSGVAAILRTNRPPLTQAEPPPPEPAAPPAQPPQAKTDEHRTRFAYDGLDRFRVTRTSADRPNGPLAFVLERRGLVGWKLVAIELPPT